MKRDLQDPELISPEHIQAQEVVRNPSQNHDRMDLGRRYGLLAMIHEATKQRCRTLPKSKLNPVSIADIIKDDIDVTEAVHVFHLSNIHSVSNPCNISIGHIFW